MRPALAVALAAAIAGLAISVYLTAVHYSAAPLACSAGGLVNCERVLTSPYGVILGTSIPTSAAGIAWFAVAAVLAFARLRGAELATVHLVWVGLGIVTVLGLVFVEIDRLGAICAWCSAAHACVVVTLLAVLGERPAQAP